MRMINKIKLHSYLLGMFGGIWLGFALGHGVTQHFVTESQNIAKQALDATEAWKRSYTACQDYVRAFGR